MSHTSQYSFGLSTIKIGDILGDGGMGTTLNVLGQTAEDTCELVNDDPETTEFYVEESDDPVVQISKAGKSTLKLTVADPDIETLETLFGGTTIGETPNRVWHYPATIPTIEKSIEVTPANGFTKFNFPRCSMTAKFNSKFSKKTLFQIEVTALLLTPTKAGLTKMYVNE